MQIIKLIFLYCCLISTNIFADTLDSFIRSFTTQRQLVSWVVNNSKYKITEVKAKSIITDVFTHAISNGLDPILLIALIKVESEFNQNAVAKGNSVGLMQIVPRWHRDKLKKRNPLDTSVSIEVGTIILKDCMLKTKTLSKGLSCYSGGGGNVYANKVLDHKRRIQSFLNTA